jgi:hypothetical protein
MKDERDRLYDAVKEIETTAHKVASRHSEECEIGSIARYVEHSMHGIGHQIAPQRDCNHTGPAQVTTDAYRKNWETIFGTPMTAGKA